MASNPETLYLSRLGDRVRAWRSEHGVTRKALSAACGVSERYLAQLEAGEGNISVLLLRKVARAMGVPVEQLVREDAPDERPIALLGPNGAGKSTLGEKLAQALGVRFVELDREVEKEAGAALGEVFAMYGQDAYRRFERRALERVLAQNEQAVIATGGSLVNDPGTYKLLLERCSCIWLKASPEEHMARVIAQGDM
ncbi:MAG: shikimate kinase, partial [Burkholderiales bacterium]